MNIAKYCDTREDEIMKSIIVPNEIIKIIYSYDFDFQEKISRTFNGHKYPIVFIEQLSDGRILSYDTQRGLQTNESGNLIIWNINTGISEITIPIQIYIGNILIMKNNHIACIDIKNNLIIFDPNTGNKLYENHFDENFDETFFLLVLNIRKDDLFYNVITLKIFKYHICCLIQKLENVKNFFRARSFIHI